MSQGTFIRRLPSQETPGKLANALSQINIHKPLSSTNYSQGYGSQGGAGGGLSQGEPVLSQDVPMSQDFFCTPDFITPVEQTFGLDYEHAGKENVGQKSPIRLTPQKKASKRLRPDLISSQSPTRGLSQDMNLSQDSCSQQSQPSQPSASTLMAAPPAIHNYKPPGLSRSITKRFARSPPCRPNPFLGSEEEGRPVKVRTMGPQVRPNERFKADFKELQQLGKGSFGKVLKVLGRLDGCEYAIKKSSWEFKNDCEEQAAVSEVMAMAAAGSHPNIVRYYSSWMESSRLYIQMELCEGSLSAQMSAGRTFSNEEVIDVMRQVGDALRHLHERDICHMDVKPDNIFTQGSLYKLGDFGQACVRRKGVDVQEGDGKYMPLEAFNGPEALDKVDMFSLGATCYALMLGRELPGSGPEFHEIRKGELKMVPVGNVSLLNVIKNLVDPDPAVRKAADALLRSTLFQSTPGSGGGGKAPLQFARTNSR